MAPRKHRMPILFDFWVTESELGLMVQIGCVREIPRQLAFLMQSWIPLPVSKPRNALCSVSHGLSHPSLIMSEFVC